MFNQLPSVCYTFLTCIMATTCFQNQVKTIINLFFKVQTFPGINKQHIVTMETYCKKLIRKEKVEDLLVR